MKKYKKIQIVLLAVFLLSNYSYAYKYIGEKKNTNNEKSLAAGCVTPAGRTIFEYNNVRCMVFTGGDMWWDLQGNAFYEVPKGSGKMALFAGAIWIGGTDVNGQLRVAAARYRQVGQDYFTGPLKYTGNDKGNTTPEMCTKYDKHFPITRAEVAKFRSWYRAKQENNTTLLNSIFADYEIPDNIRNWPGNNFEPDYLPTLAPFWDENEDGIYNPDDGDYPLYDLDKTMPCGTTPDKRKPKLYGDATIWWVYNDRGNVHTETGGASIGMEIQAQYFAFATNDELNNMTFGNYGLYNRSSYTLEDCYFGVWTDADLGDAWDDYVGTDVNRGLGYLYNGDEQDGDGNGYTYGVQPPAIGVDFFEGPYQDPDNQDNLSNWDTIGGHKVLDCSKANIAEGSINGLNFQDGVVDDERWGMRRFLYFNNGGCVTCDPQTAIEYYRMLRGYWRDGTRMTYGGNGYGGTTPADFMFPYDSDPCAWGTGGIQQSDLWSEALENNQPYDRRFVQSSGPFTLLPGATNDITVGMVWARAAQGGAWASVAEVKRADDKAQRLFEVCFKLIDGPDAPDLQIVELDRELIFHIYNIKGNSNNYVNTNEDYEEVDPFIVCPEDMPDCDNKYRFQGYQVFQLKDESCSVNDIYDKSKARLVFQCDIKDSVSRLINFEYDNDIGYSVPVVKVEGADAGIQHTFRITDDAFATGDKRLVNHKTYYYVAIAYAYNNYKKYDPNDPSALDGQKFPYLASRAGSNKLPIRVYSAMPHIPSTANNGTILNSSYGHGPKIVQLDGHGNGNNELKLTEETINKILSSPNHKTDSVEYENNYGPILIKVVDPLNVKSKDFILKFLPSESTINSTDYSITSTKWICYDINDTSDKVISESAINVQNEQLIAKWGISITISQTPWPLKDDPNAYQNGYINSKIIYENPNDRWVEFLPDVDGCDFPNWIRAGTVVNASDQSCNDFYDNSSTPDSKSYYEKVVDGTWAPYALTMKDIKGSATSSAQTKGLQFYKRIEPQLSTSKHRLSSIMVVITKDKTKWSRCPVIETSDFDIETGFVAGMSEGGVKKFQLRQHPSVDKNGNSNNIGDSTNANYSNYISSTGMGWFPGYVIDMETGERLNIAFGENSRYGSQNGKDMIWNPTSDYADPLYYQTGGLSGELLIGGQHYIWVFGHNDKPSNSATLVDTMPRYDEGRYLVRRLKQLQTLTGANYDNRMAMLWNNAMWAAIPMLNPNIVNTTNSTDPYWFIKGEVRIYISIANPYQKSTNELISPNAPNEGYPMYFFSLKDVAPVVNDKETAINSLDLIKVVPNPYYGYSGYESSQLDNKVRITNLPQKCTISIYNVNGTLIRRFKKDSPLSYQDWDLKNEYNITIASGMYIIHIDAPGIGEKIVKWFGALRPIDLNNF